MIFQWVHEPAFERGNIATVVFQLTVALRQLNDHYSADEGLHEGDQPHHPMQGAGRHGASQDY